MTVQVEGEGEEGAEALAEHFADGASRCSIGECLHHHEGKFLSGGVCFRKLPQHHPYLGGAGWTACDEEGECDFGSYGQFGASGWVCSECVPLGACIRCGSQWSHIIGQRGRRADVYEPGEPTIPETQRLPWCEPCSLTRSLESADQALVRAQMTVAALEEDRRLDRGEPVLRTHGGYTRSVEGWLLETVGLHPLAYGGRTIAADPAFVVDYSTAKTSYLSDPPKGVPRRPTPPFGQSWDRGKPVSHPMPWDEPWRDDSDDRGDYRGNPEYVEAPPRPHHPPLRTVRFHTGDEVPLSLRRSGRSRHHAPRALRPAIRHSAFTSGYSWFGDDPVRMRRDRLLSEGPEHERLWRESGFSRALSGSSSLSGARH